MKSIRSVSCLVACWLLFVCCYSSFADISVPETVEYGHQIKIVVTNPPSVPQDATVDRLLEVEYSAYQPSEQKLSKPPYSEVAPLFESLAYGCWADPGVWQAKQIVSWYKSDEQGNISHGLLSEKVYFTVVGEVKPDPNPDDDDGDDDVEPQPNPNAKWQVMFFSDKQKTAGMTNDQLEMVSSLVFRKELVSKGHTFVGSLDDDSRLSSVQAQCPNGVCASTPTDAWYAAIQGKTLPVVAFAPKEGGDIQVFSLPKTVDAFWKLLGGLQ
jgi:hypothetical protein